MNYLSATRAATVFQAAFGQAPLIFAHAPGRVNLIGEHTDYNDGLVLPCAIDYGTVIAARMRDDHLVRAVAADYDEAIDEVALDAPIARLDTPMWANYVRGMLQQTVQRGLPMRGMDIVITGDIPQGTG